MSAPQGTIEKRTYIVEFRASKSEEKRTVSGYAAVFNRYSEDLGWYREVIKPGAFSRALKNSDCRALLNHDPNHLLGRESSGTLKLSEDRDGLKFDLDLPQSRADVMELVERGDMKECSFAFRVSKQVWKEEKQQDDTVLTTREIEEVDYLKDITLATFPAYPDTTVAKRCYEEWRGDNLKEQKESTFDLQAYQARERELIISESFHKV